LVPQSIPGSRKSSRATSRSKRGHDHPQSLQVSPVSQQDTRRKPGRAVRTGPVPRGRRISEWHSPALFYPFLYLLSSIISNR
jgi:hypothetical protein